MSYQPKNKAIFKDGKQIFTFGFGYKKITLNYINTESGQETKTTRNRNDEQVLGLFEKFNKLTLLSLKDKLSLYSDFRQITMERGK